MFIHAISLYANRASRVVVGGGGWKTWGVGRFRLGCNYGPGRGPSGVCVTSNDRLPVRVLYNEPNCVGFLSTFGS